MFHSRGVSSAAAAAAEPPVARKAGTGVLTAACVSALVVNANTSAVTILLPAISEEARRARPADLAAAAAVTTHTIPVPQEV